MITMDTIDRLAAERDIAAAVCANSVLLGRDAEAHRWAAAYETLAQEWHGAVADYVAESNARAKGHPDGRCCQRAA